MGYVSWAHDLCAPLRSDGDFDYFFFGWLVLFAPIGVPVYWIGRLAKWAHESK